MAPNEGLGYCDISKERERCEAWSRAYEAFVSAELEGTAPVLVSYESGNGPSVLLKEALFHTPRMRLSRTPSSVTIAAVKSIQADSKAINSYDHHRAITEHIPALVAQEASVRGRPKLGATRG